MPPRELFSFRPIIIKPRELSALSVGRAVWDYDSDRYPFRACCQLLLFWYILPRPPTLTTPPPPPAAAAPNTLLRKRIYGLNDIWRSLRKTQLSSLYGVIMTADVITTQIRKIAMSRGRRSSIANTRVYLLPVHVQRLCEKQKTSANPWGGEERTPSLPTKIHWWETVATRTRENENPLGFRAYGSRL